MHTDACTYNTYIYLYELRNLGYRRSIYIFVMVGSIGILN